MSMITAADMPDHQMVSVVIPGIYSDYQNHSPLSVLDVSQGGQTFTVHIYRGKKFSDGDGESFTPLAYLALHEYQLLKPLLGDCDSERSLFLEWEKINILVMAIRHLRTEAQDYVSKLSWVPDEHRDAANLAVSLVFGEGWTLDNIGSFPGIQDEGVI